ncbi:MAG: NAD-dependent dihydropyrimidine dehydrogenase subunit PreA [Planctomycetota bacterium]
MKSTVSKDKSDLSISFCGLELSNPFILASGPPTRNDEMILRGFEEGWAGAVTKTISFSPTQSPHPRLSIIDKTKSLVNIELISSDTVQQWVKWISTIKKTAPHKIIIASIMASAKTNDWQKLARIMADAGADALELNISCPHGMPERGMGSLIGQNPRLSATITHAVKKAVSIPVIVKLTPNVTDIKLIAKACAQSGADALSGINTVKSLAGIDIEKLSPLPSVNEKGTFGGYAGQGIKPIALRCVAEMFQATKLPISAGGGIFNWNDAVEFLLIGARTLQLCSAVMFSGYPIIHSLKKGLQKYIQQHNFRRSDAPIRSVPYPKASGRLEQLVALSQKKLVRHSSLKSQNLTAVINQNKCPLKSTSTSHCHRCLVACRDGGLQAIAFKNHRCTISKELCDGCGLCVSVCPNQAIKLE